MQISLGEMRYLPAPPPQPVAPPERRRLISWKQIDEWLAVARTAILNGLLVVSVIALLGVMASDLNRDVVVIDPIRLPATLTNMGYSEDVAAYRLWDEVVRINEGTPTAKDRVALLPASQRVDFEAPGAGVSLQALVQMLRRFLGMEETRIAGEFICTTTDCKPEGLALRLRVFRGNGMQIISLPPIGYQASDDKIDRYFHTAARDLLRELDPYVLAFYLYQTDKAAAKREALQIINPTHPQLKWALNLLGLVAADSGEYDAAIGWYKRAVAADPDDEFAVAYINWGDALRAKGDPDAAIERFTRATELDPDYALAYSSWGNALSDKGDLAGAIAKHARVVELDPENALAYSNLGNAVFKNGDPGGAIAQFRQAIEIDPQHAPAYKNWGIVLEDQGDLDGAIAQYRRAAELDPTDPGVQAKWGIVLRKQGDLDGAIAKYRLAIEIDPTYAFAYNNLGVALGNMGDIDGAMANFIRATDLNPTDAKAHFNKALALQFQNRVVDAADSFQRYLDLRPDAENAERVRAQIEELRAAAPAD
jgi:superkiller protein 3